MPLEQTWRWFGPLDPVPLPHVLQAGATGIVTALHHLPNGEVWSIEEIRKRQAEIALAAGADAPLTWSVVESVPVHEDIRRGLPTRDRYIQAYCKTIENLSACGIDTVCYNFMPVLDWTRTDLHYLMPDGSEALRFNALEITAFDLFILQRPDAERDYTEAELTRAESCFAAMSKTQQHDLTRTIIAGLPGAEEGYTLDQFRAALRCYHGVGPEELREHLIYFLSIVAPVAERSAVRLAIHPDDPPWPLFGLPRVVSTEADVEHLLRSVDIPANGFTMCTGSFGARADNDLPGIVDRLGSRIHFVHLRSTQREPDHIRSFHEADHLGGDVDMAAVMLALLQEQRRRRKEGRSDARLPFRPDHGHRMLDDLQKRTNPGYSAIGRLRGLAELRGLMTGLEYLMDGTPGV